MKKKIRKTFLVNKSLQLRYMAMVAIMMTAISIITGWAIYTTTWMTLLDKCQNQIAMIDEIFLDLNNLLFIRISLLILSGVCIGVIIVMFMVHRIAGPLFRVKKILGIIGNGIIPPKVHFRKKDELKDIADTVNEVISKISELQGGNLNTIEKVKVCLKRAEDCMKNNLPQTDKAAKEIESALKTLSDIRTFKKQEEGKCKRGMTLLELLIGVFIIAILIAGGGFQLKGLIQRAKVSAAKTTITGFGLALSMIKDDMGIYPPSLAGTKEASLPEDFPPGFDNRNWCGPYAMTLSTTDPWGNDYVYGLDEGIVFGPQSFETHTDENIVFSALPGKGTIIVENPGITSGRIEINGEEIVGPDEFKHTTPKIEKDIYNLDRSNILYIWLQSDPKKHIKITITAALSKDTTFTLYSTGRNGITDYDEEDEDYDDIEYGDF